ncbi:MAG: hypothetical protein M1831_001123 [Alyxoria varia]|nr:MAG: hypothetical protein M1831_001123 [Alyxoria varia]
MDALKVLGEALGTFVWVKVTMTLRQLGLLAQNEVRAGNKRSDEQSQWSDWLGTKPGESDHRNADASNDLEFGGGDWVMTKTHDDKADEFW